MYKKGKGNGKGGIIIFVLIIIGLLIWGYFWREDTTDLTTCNIHFGIFCWKWTGAVNATTIHSWAGRETVTPLMDQVFRHKF